ncbi:hypothetical protein B0H13DRAFT_1634924 [Mycena leptocephala]|nr:hypothetical protein B0H13DRAFT_1634924 [Mycena leptocephala]
MPRRPNFVDIDIEDTPRGHALTADKGVYFSADGLRRQEELLNVAHKQRRVQPSELADLYGQWIPLPEDGDGADNGVNPVDSVSSVPGNKRKEYASSDDPMSEWRPLKGKFLDELLWHDGLGNDFHDPKCAHCKTLYIPGSASAAPMRIFKCEDCRQFLQCQECCLSHHALTPLHAIKEWTGCFWKGTTLADLGLVYQLGHGGFACVFPDEKVHKMTVIEAPTIHQVRVRYCSCSKSDNADNLEQLLRNGWYPASVTDPGTCATFKTLEAYRLYNVVGNMNVNDFIHSLERGTDATASTGMAWLPDRYKQFQRMARQWAFLKRIKRAGRGHDPSGVDATELRACAVNCWACPQDGRNLPDNWRDSLSSHRFLYMLLLAVDANFKLKNRMRANEIDDPSLGPGWGYWVEPTGYKHHLKKYVGEKDISTCIAFAALLQKDTRMTTGLRASGVGGCVCARHECVRPNGIGDLQKGERYANMDYIVASALFGFALLFLTISYDIACQWKQNLPDRNAKLPSRLRLPLENITVQCALPVWHASSHNESCQNDNSLSFKPGVGKSDGEGVEQVWSVLNPASYHTKDAGHGQRVDTLEDKIDSHNFQKNIGQGEALQRKLLVAIAERDRQVAEFKACSSTVETRVLKVWKNEILEWEKDPSKHKNPYTLSRKDCPTEAEVRLEVKKDEEALHAAGASAVLGRSATAFLIAGLQIEDAQRRIVAELGGRALLTADREGKLVDWRRALLVKIGKYRDLQQVYMPGAALAIATHDAARDPDALPPKPEKIKLFMPSQMPVPVPTEGGDPLRGCVRGLLSMEAKLRTAQCNNALVKLRARLHAKRHFIAFRNENLAGQAQATRAQTLIGQIGERADACVVKYRHARTALITLSGEANATQFRELRPEDVQLDGDAGESDAASRKKLAMLSAGRGARAPRNAPGTSKRVMSWIWTAPGALDDAEARLHESVQVEWSRARARKVRWEEEVLTLREEMRRVLRYLGWQSQWWRDHVHAREEDAPELSAGISAYALKQADLHDRLAVFYQGKWNTSASAAARRIVALEDAAVAEDADLGEFFQ